MTTKNKTPIFRWDGDKWYQANAGLFKKRLEYPSIRQAKDEHPEAVFINPKTIEPVRSVPWMVLQGY